jgi:Zn-dependent protease
MVFSLVEIFEILVTILGVGYIFSGILRRPRHEFEVYYEKKRFDWDDIKYSAIIAAPAVIFHEFAHKFVALGLGYSATYSASYFGLALGAFLRAISSGLIFFIPGYVSISGGADPGTFALIAVVGPLANLLLFIGAHYALENGWLPKYGRILYLTKKINMWLFIFNILPIPGFDGYKFFSGLFQMI